MPGRFESVQMNQAQRSLSIAVREQCEGLEALLGGVSEGRYKAIALTRLEEAAMFANKAISHGGFTGELPTTDDAPDLNVDPANPKPPGS